MKLKTLVALCLVLPFTLQAHTHRPDYHAPIQVMGDHTHNTGEWMLSARMMSMSMNEIQNGKSVLSEDAFFEETSYMMAPKSMSMTMYMIGGMTALSDKVTVSAMLPLIQKEMTMVRKTDGAEIDRDTQGIGDAKLTTLIRLFSDKDSSAHWISGVSLPLGSITEETDGTRLGYGMQLGSGTPDIRNGLSFTRMQEEGSYGFQILTLLRPFKNKEGYSLGDEVSFTAWKAKVLSHSFSTSLRTNFKGWGGIKGSDGELNAMMSPGKSTTSGGELLDLSWGLNYIHQSGALKGHRLALEAGLPVYEQYHGYRLKTEWWATLGWQYTL